MKLNNLKKIIATIFPILLFLVVNTVRADTFVIDYSPPVYNFSITFDWSCPPYAGSAYDPMAGYIYRICGSGTFSSTQPKALSLTQIVTFQTDKPSYLPNEKVTPILQTSSIKAVCYDTGTNYIYYSTPISFDQHASMSYLASLYTGARWWHLLDTPLDNRPSVLYQIGSYDSVNFDNSWTLQAFNATSTAGDFSLFTWLHDPATFHNTCSGYPADIQFESYINTSFNVSGGNTSPQIFVR